jgi:hypothetical protein
MQYPENVLKTTYVDPICNTLMWVLTNVLIMASLNTKVKKSNPIVIPAFGLSYSYWGYATSSWVYLGLFLGARILYGPKLN